MQPYCLQHLSEEKQPFILESRRLDLVLRPLDPPLLLAKLAVEMPLNNNEQLRKDPGVAHLLLVPHSKGLIPFAES